MRGDIKMECPQWKRKIINNLLYNINIIYNAERVGMSCRTMHLDALFFFSFSFSFSFSFVNSACVGSWLLIWKEGK